MLIAEQTIAVRRKHGANRFLFVYADDQHDFAKVNSRIRSVKIFLSMSRRDQLIPARRAGCGSLALAEGKNSMASRRRARWDRSPRQWASGRIVI
jgi:hypothetical protein